MDITEQENHTGQSVRNRKQKNWDAMARQVDNFRDGLG